MKIITAIAIIAALSSCSESNSSKFNRYAKKFDSLSAAYDRTSQNIFTYDKVKSIADSMHMCIDSMEKYKIKRTF